MPRATEASSYLILSHQAPNLDGIDFHDMNTFPLIFFELILLYLAIYKLIRVFYIFILSAKENIRHVRKPSTHHAFEFHLYSCNLFCIMLLPGIVWSISLDSSWSVSS